MTTGQWIRKYYLKRIIGWLLIVAVLSVICVIYHSSPSASFHPLISAALIALLSIWLMFYFELAKYFADRSFSGNITDMKVYSSLDKKITILKTVDIRVFVSMTVKCDDGKTVRFEQMLPEHDTRSVPYRIGDRVFHIKGAPHTCRFPRNDTETVYDPVSVICPICGACLPLGSTECAFCKTELPQDPITK